MYKAFFIFCFVLFFFFYEGYSQSTGNVPLKSKSKFGRYYGAGDVWGVKINNVNYALVTLDGGLSIVNTNNTSNPIETVHINRTGYDPEDRFANRLWVPDVETYTKSGVSYAYLATNDPSTTNNNPLVIIINLNAALAQPGLILIDPINDTPNPSSVFAGKIEDFWEINRSHTLTIEDGFLYVATINKYLPIWYLRDTPANPALVSIVTNTTPKTELHEMEVVSKTMLLFTQHFSRAVLKCII